MQPIFACSLFRVCGPDRENQGHDADDREKVVVKTHGSAEDMRVGAEVSLPKSVADAYFKIEARRPVVGMEYAAQLGLHVEQCKIIRRDRLTLDASGLRRAGDIDGPAYVRRHISENPGTLKVLPLGHGQTNAARADAGKIVLDADELFGMVVGQRDAEG